MRRSVRILGALLLFSSCRASRPDREAAFGALSPRARVDAIARSCARIASCAHPHDPLHFRDPAACVDHWILEEEAPTLACLASAVSCDDVGTCLHHAPNAYGEAFCQARAGSMSGCAGTRLVTCGGDDPDEATVVDCASLGATCSELTQPGGLSTHACVDPRRCPIELTRAWCDGKGAVLSCHDGEIQRTVCPAGSPCEAHADPDGEEAADCDAPGHASCSAPGTRRCAGTRLLVCEAHGHFAHQRVVDCAASGLTCTEEAGRGACTEGAPLCARGHTACEGDALTFCAAGRKRFVPCPELGFAGCTPDGRGPEATCGPSH